jgi:hypothetical protein
VLVLVACEFSGRVRDAFTELGHDAWSADLEPSETPGPHYQGDVRDILDWGWDLMIAHPPCTHLANSGRKWFAEKEADGRQQAALDFVVELLDAPIPKIALENPMGVIGTRTGRPATQMVHPWMFGDDASKATCLWLKGLPKLVHGELLLKERYANQDARGREKINGPKEDRSRNRSRTYPGIARAMALQWGGDLRPQSTPVPVPALTTDPGDMQAGETLQAWLRRVGSAHEGQTAHAR